MMKFFRFYALVFSVVALLAACGSTEDFDASIQLDVSAEGPFFSGPNTLQAEYTVNLKSLIANKEFTANDIKEVKVKSVTIKIPEGDAIGIDSFNNVVVQLASDNAPMTNIAILNPINGNGNELTLTSSADAEIEDFFKQEKFIVLVDWDFKEDSMRPEMHSNVKIDLVFKLKQ